MKDVDRRKPTKWDRYRLKVLARTVGNRRWNINWVIVDRDKFDRMVDLLGAKEQYIDTAKILGTAIKVKRKLCKLKTCQRQFIYVVPNQQFCDLSCQKEYFSKRFVLERRALRIMRRRITAEGRTFKIYSDEVQEAVDKALRTITTGY